MPARRSAAAVRSNIANRSVTMLLIPRQLQSRARQQVVMRSDYFTVPHARLGKVNPLVRKRFFPGARLMLVVAFFHTIIHVEFTGCAETFVVQADEP